ncbi:MAG TPA: glycoside hydrolase family 2 TIM barrel-domain containing protein [Bryobacteraceae bacterium]|jgi:beta-glucuronidase|nr:glycoside hydrolase family 2 TIM barrel-domain containing protein [Bryobacteraceae bacterium]
MMKNVWLFVAPAILAGSSFAAEQAPLIQNVRGRETVSLDGQWKAIVDPYQSGYLDYRYKPHADGGMGANKKPSSPSDLVEYDFDTAGQLAVPGDWNTQRPELLLYEGAVWYKKDFDYAGKPGRRQFVWFGAANYHAIVFLNGKKLGEHVGGFTPFQFEVTGLLRDTGNFLIAMVDDERHAEGVPTLMTDWWNYGGLTRGVKLVDVADTFIEDYLVQLAKGSQTRIAGWVRVNGPDKQQPVTIRIPEVGISQSVTPDANGYAAFTVDAHLSLWSPENPKLYDVSIERGADRVADCIGFRSIEAVGNTLLLNGQPLHLRGISVHAESPIHTARLFAEADARTLLEWAKETGCNFVRLPHYPHDEVMTRLADEMGLLVWSEVPVYWTIAWENPDTLRNAEQQITEMISRDKNRGSVILWSVANETPIGEPRTKFLSTLAALAHELDSTRLVTAALETHRIDADTVMVDDPLGKVLDVVSCNEYIGWYDGLPEKTDRAQWKTAYDKPFVLSEFGADAQAGRHGPANERWTEEFQADVYRRQVAMFRRIPFLSGTIAWVLVDFRSPRRPLAGIQDYFNRKGLFSDRGQRKQAFYILRDYYRSLAVTSKSE